MQINTLRVGIRQAVGIVFFHKKFGTRQTEAVDALLDIADHKNIADSAPLPGYRPKDGLLDLVAVLVLIYHDFRKMLLKFLRRLFYGSGFLIHKNFQRKMLQIMKIDQVFPPLFLRKGIREFQRQPHQLPCHRGGFP